MSALRGCQYMKVERGTRSPGAIAFRDQSGWSPRVLLRVKFVQPQVKNVAVVNLFWLLA